jgi:hypothetical protein
MELGDRFHLGGNCIRTEKTTSHPAYMHCSNSETWPLRLKDMISFELENNVFLPDIVKYSSH